MQNIISQWILWQFFEVPKELLKAWKNFLLFNLNYFSVPLLLKTLFSPWRRYKVSTGKGLDLGRFFEAVFSNLIFRLLGAIMRGFMIILGLLTEIFIILAGITIFFGWLLLPVLLVWGFIFGIQILI